MNEYDSIKYSLTFIMNIIIGIFLFLSIIDIHYIVKHFFGIQNYGYIITRTVFQIFITYFISDMLYNLYDERYMFIDKRFKQNRYKVTIRYSYNYLMHLIR